MSSRLYVAAFLFATMACARASASTPLSVFPQQVGESIHYRMTRTTQAADGTRAQSIDLTIVRKTPTTASLSQTIAPDHIDITVLVVAPDGSISIPQNDQADRADAQLRDILAGLNRAIAIVRNAGSDPASGWNAAVTLSNGRGSDTSLTVPITVMKTGTNDWDMRGLAQSALGQSQESGNQSNPNRGGGFPGGGRGGGFPGNFPRGGRSGGSPPMTVLVLINGHVHNGALSRLTITETRSVTVESMPFTNTNGWIIETSNGKS